MTSTDYQQQWYQGISEQQVPAPVQPPVSRINHIDQARYWVGAVLTAVVAALAGVIGLVVIRDLMRVPISLGSIGLPGDNIGSYGLMVGLAALLAAALFNGMLAIAPRPTVYFGALTGLLTALAALLPFTSSMSISAQAAVAGINLVVGVLIMVLVPLAASNAGPRTIIVSR
jgi:hypothetical protein